MDNMTKGLGICCKYRDNLMHVKEFMNVYPKLDLHWNIIYKSAGTITSQKE